MVMPSIILIGFKGCGKTTVGRLLAEALKRRFVDLDNVIVDLHEARSGARAPFREIFRRIGSKEFRALELQAAIRVRDDLIASPAPAVLSVGGGAFVHEDTREVLKPLGQVVCLKAPFEELLARILRNGLPAFVSKPHHAEVELHDYFLRREPTLLKYADVVVNIAGCDPLQALQRTREALAL
ncbi:MAG: shikimate kinase [Candidatus Sumerlaeota bacterium]|nr:shikimate kinase [Candidatus Sumerlaeota bacterium]